MIRLRSKHLALSVAAAASLLALPAAARDHDATWPDAPAAPGVVLRGPASSAFDSTWGQGGAEIAAAPALALDTEQGSRLEPGAEEDGGPVQDERTVAHLEAPAARLATARR